MDRFFGGLVGGMVLFLLISGATIIIDLNPKMRSSEPMKKVRQYQRYKLKWRLIFLSNAFVYATVFTLGSLFLSLELGFGIGVVVTLFSLIYIIGKWNDAREKEQVIMHHLLEKDDEEDDE